jgi:NAD(P) transhydrogenase subunit alpha
MKPGTVVVDMAIETGGNVEGAKLDEEVTVHGVILLGFSNLPSRVPEHASQMYASNLTNLLEHFWDKEAKSFPLKREDEIIDGALVTHEGEIVNATLRTMLNLDKEQA